MISGSLSRRYAKALLQLGVESRDYERLGRELDLVAKTIEGSKELKATLESPVFPLTQRKAVLADILRRLAVSPVVTHFVLLVLDHNRIQALSAINREMAALVDQQAGRLRAVVTSARPMGEPEIARIKRALEARTGKQLLIERKQDPSLLGGVVVQIGDIVYDGSVRTQLRQIKEQLLQTE